MNQMPKPKCQMPNVRGERGFTLVETIIALFVLAVGVTGVFVFLDQTLAVTPDPMGRLEALYLAQEGVEIVRNIRDANFAKIVDAQEGVNWLDGLGDCGSGCEADWTSTALVNNDRFLQRVDGFYQYDGAGDLTTLKRKISVIPMTATKADVVVEVTWEIRGMPRSASVSTHIYNWLQ